MKILYQFLEWYKICSFVSVVRKQSRNGQKLNDQSRPLLKETLWLLKTAGVHKILIENHKKNLSHLDFRVFASSTSADQVTL